MRKFKAMIVSVSALAALSAITASAAMATPAVFNTTGPLSLNTTGLTIKIGATPTPAQTITCSSPLSMIGKSAENSGSPLQGRVSGLRIFGTCKMGTGGTAYIDLAAQGWDLANKTGSVFSLAGADQNWVGSINTSSYYSYAGAGSDGISNYTAPWTNGTSVEKPSSVTFTEAAISKITTGTFVGQTVKLSGTVQFAREGELLTLK